jgi:ferredoxin--NADP+ reductase
MKAGIETVVSSIQQDTAAEIDTLNAVLTNRYDWFTRFSVLRVSPDSGRVRDFLPGQHVTVGLPVQSTTNGGRNAQFEPETQLIRRMYSIASPATEHRYLEFFVARVQDGRPDTHLSKLQVGSRIWIADHAEGGVTLQDVDSNRDLIWVSTGTAIAPCMSIVRTYRGQQRWRRLVIINAARHADDLGYRHELEAAARTDPSIHYIPIVSREREGSDWLGLRGHVQDVLGEDRYFGLVNAPLYPEQCDVFLCGNPGMIRSVQPLLEHQGFRVHGAKDPGNLHVERY